MYPVAELECNIMKRTFRISSKAGNSSDVEINIGVSMTVPDQSMTIRDIIDKFAHGVVPDLSRDLEYSEDMPDLRGMDISELHEMRKQVKQDIKDIEEEIKSRKSKSKEEETPPPSSETPPLADPNPVEPPKTE